MTISRLTFSSNLLLIQNRLAQAGLDYQKAAIPATTGMAINNLSDDSSVISHLFSLRSSSLNTAQFQKNITNVTSKLNFTDSQIAQASDVLQRAREIAIRANDGSVSGIALSELATQMTGLKTELQGYANAKLDNRYIFAGTAITTQPFVSAGDGTVSFSSSANSVANSEYINSTLTMPTNTDGNTLFTGATSTATGATLLTAARNSTGMSLGINAGDSITIAGTVGATPVSTTYTVTSASTLANLATALQSALTGVADGDTTETAAVSSGAIRVTSDGSNAITGLTLSISGNTTFNTAFTYPTTIAGGAATGDSNALKTSTAEDLFNVIDNLATAITNNDNTSLVANMARLDLGINQLAASRASLGTQLQQLDATSNFLTDDSARVMQALSNIQDAPMDKVLSNLMTRETALRLVYASSQKILNAASITLMQN